MNCRALSRCDIPRHQYRQRQRPTAAVLAGLLLAALAPGTSSAVTAPPQGVQIYSIQLGAVGIGTSRIVWQRQATGMQSNAVVHISAMLDQHQKLQLDHTGLPSHYRLDATVQGHHTRLDVTRTPTAIVEQVVQDGRHSTTRLPTTKPVDWLDNNSFDTLQALLKRHHGELAAGTTLRVFVPQARQFGQFTVKSMEPEQTSPADPEAGDASPQVPAQPPQLRLKVQLEVANKTVPLVLVVNAGNGQLLRYRQPTLGVTVNLAQPGPIP